MIHGSASISDISIFWPYSNTFGCFLDISQPTCEKKKPRLALCGSASVSEYLWCCRWSRTHTYRQFYSKRNQTKLFSYVFGFHLLNTHIYTCPASVCNHSKNIFNDLLALNDLCDHSLWAPIVTPNPEPKISKIAACTSGN